MLEVGIGDVVAIAPGRCGDEVDGRVVGGVVGEIVETCHDMLEVGIVVVAQ